MSKLLGIFYAFCFTAGFFLVPASIIGLFYLIMKYWGPFGLLCLSGGILFCITWIGMYKDFFSEK